MSFTCIPVQIEPNKSPLRRKLLALLLWEIVHLPPQAKNKKQKKKNHLFFFLEETYDYPLAKLLSASGPLHLLFLLPSVLFLLLPSTFYHSDFNSNAFSSQKLSLSILFVLSFSPPQSLYDITLLHFLHSLKLLHVSVYLFILFHTLEYKLHWNRILFVSPEHKEHLAYSNCSTHICWGQVQCNIPHRNTLWVEDTKFCKHSKENECGQPGWSANLPEKLTLGSGSWRIKKR